MNFQNVTAIIYDQYHIVCSHIAQSLPLSTGFCHLDIILCNCFTKMIKTLKIQVFTKISNGKTIALVFTIYMNNTLSQYILILLYSALTYKINYLNFNANHSPNNYIYNCIHFYPCLTIFLQY